MYSMKRSIRLTSVKMMIQAHYGFISYPYGTEPGVVFKAELMRHPKIKD